MNRAAALIEARRRWGDDAWICGPRREGPPYAVGFVISTNGSRSTEHEMGTGDSWERAIAAADAMRKRTGFERAYQRGGIVAVVDGWHRNPSLSDASKVLAKAAAVDVHTVQWCWREGAFAYSVMIRRCGCGHTMLHRVHRCDVCRALDDLVEKAGSATLEDLGVLRASADRYMDRVGAVMRELERRLRDRSAAQLRRIVEEQGGTTP